MSLTERTPPPMNTYTIERPGTQEDHIVQAARVTVTSNLSLTGPHDNVLKAFDADGNIIAAYRQSAWTAFYLLPEDHPDA